MDVPLPTETAADIAADWLPYRSKSLAVPGLSGTTHQLRYLDEGPRESSGNGVSPSGTAPSGTGTILCVHGNPTWSFYYRQVVKRFAADHRVIAVDHIGCGRSDKPDVREFDYCLASHRDNLLRLVRELDLRNVTLLVHDWGGAIGLASLVEEIHRFDRAIVLNTAAFPPPYVPLRIAACRWPVVGPLGVRGLNSFARAAQFMTTSRAPLSDEAKRGLIAPYNSWANRVAINAFVLDIPMHRSHRTYAVLETLESRLKELSNLPIQLIWGMQDWCFRPECLDRFEAIWPHANALRIADAGHYVLEDASEETLHAIEAFIKQPIAAKS